MALASRRTPMVSVNAPPPPRPSCGTVAPPRALSQLRKTSLKAAVSKVIGNAKTKVVAGGEGPLPAVAAVGPGSLTATS